ncbi:invasion associated locus B family protein, partial [Agrobacterium rhizogenes]|nr:invasion associated locus B family protein [Rhizobium rhizogenes]NTG39411.1 invasion associated locus B family protein [Rhizobium rhizogenes]NTH43147.1 invasion associated locus B family protein [Rhizobium rhizogenes]NTH56023.1 invasion associated locus B family protein [Rhizobium rhizogenes]NTH87652.1 invasion associated locus B family protein [Rhizobium rhizogenes]
MTFATLANAFSVKTLASAVFISSTLYASFGLAQEQPAAPANAGTQQSQQSPAATAAGQTQPAPQARVQKFDDWYYRCIDGKAADGSAATHCEVAQIATVKQGDQDVNVLTLAIAKADAPAAPDK